MILSFASKQWISIRVFPKIGVPQNGWFIVENPIKMDDLGGKPTIFGNIHIFPSSDSPPWRRLAFAFAFTWCPGGCWNFDTRNQGMYLGATPKGNGGAPKMAGQWMGFYGFFFVGGGVVTNGVDFHHQNMTNRWSQNVVNVRETHFEYGLKFRVELL